MYLQEAIKYIKRFLALKILSDHCLINNGFSNANSKTLVTLCVSDRAVASWIMSLQVSSVLRVSKWPQTKRDSLARVSATFNRCGIVTKPSFLLLFLLALTHDTIIISSSWPWNASTVLIFTRFINLSWHLIK